MKIVLIDWAGTSDELLVWAIRHDVFVKPTGKYPAGGHPEISIFGTIKAVESFMKEFNP